MNPLEKFEKFLKVLGRFWQKHPALYFGTAIFWGLFLPSSHHTSAWIGAIALFIAPVSLRIQAFVLFVLFFVVAVFLFPNNSIPLEKVCQLDLIRVRQSHATLHLTFQETQTLQPYFFHIPTSEQEEFWGTRSLIAKVGPSSFLKKKQILDTHKGFSTIWLRFGVEKTIQQALRSSMHTGDLLAALTLGTPIPRSDKPLIQRLGLTPLFVVSGLHFSLFATCLFHMLRCLKRWKTKGVVMLIFLSIASLFLGPSPSVTRSYLMICLTLTAQLLGKPQNSLNFLGVALICQLLYDPHSCHHTGLHLSYFFTFSLLIGLRPLRRVIYPCLAPFVSLFCAASVTLPAVFGSFNATGFCVSMLISPLLSVMMVCMPLCLLSDTFAHRIDDLFLFCMQRLELPKSCDLLFEAYHCHPCVVSVVLTLLSILAIFFYERGHENHEELEPLIFF